MMPERPIAPVYLGTVIIVIVNLLQQKMFFSTLIDTPAGPNEFISVPGGKVTLGKSRDFPSYSWDNDYGQAVVE